MQKVLFSNGLSAIYEHKPGNSVVVQVMVKVGSNNEEPQERGISHFLEHILFEGTTKRATNQEISNEIEKIGGDFNAYTTNERTCFYVKVLKKHFSVAIEVLSDILQNSIFSKESISKEKNIILKEIDMINDEPRFYQWLLLQTHLFFNHPTKHPTYGSKKIIKELTKERIFAYFLKHYVASNMVISIVGDVSDWKKQVENKFVLKRGIATKRKVIADTYATKPTVKKEKRKIANTYTVVGFKTVAATNSDSYVLEVINGILGRGQSGKMFTEIRSKRGLAYDVGTQHISEVSFGYFAVYATIDRKNIATVRKVIAEELEKLKFVSDEEIRDAQDFVEGDYLLDLEDTQKVADQLLFWEHVGDAHNLHTFTKQIRKVTREDIARVVKKYFKNGTTVILEGK